MNSGALRSWDEHFDQGANRRICHGQGLCEK